MSKIKWMYKVFSIDTRLHFDVTISSCEQSSQLKQNRLKDFLNFHRMRLRLTE